MPIPEKMDLLSEKGTGRVKTIREAIEHMDDRIRDGKVPDRGPLAVLIKNDSIELRVGRDPPYYSALAERLGL